MQKITKLPEIVLQTDVCVIGGGLSGTFAAISAARHGAKVVLVQDRPMLGGNASSEVRMWVRGAKGTFDRETGLISEFEEKNIHYNPNLTSTVNDATLYGMVKENENITLLLNTSCYDAKTDGDAVTEIICWNTFSYTRYIIKAKYFCDSSGDSILASLVGANHRKGRESVKEFNETLAREQEDCYGMGMSIILAARETDKKVKFVAPSFANKYESDEDFEISLNTDKFMLKRNHVPSTSGDNLWWVELGGRAKDMSELNAVRDELLKSIYGVWDHIKNHGDHGMDNWDLEWVGFLPGKRESVRYEGEYMMKESDVLSGGRFDDQIAFGGWPLDDHGSFGLERNTEEGNVASRYIPVNEVYGIPYRILYSNNIKNLFFAGRNVSVSHVVLSSTRVMATCALLGQATGTAMAIANKYGLSPCKVGEKHIKLLQQTLLDDGMFLPHIKREISPLTKRAKINLESDEIKVLQNGIERPRTVAGENAIKLPLDKDLTFTFDKEEYVDILRMRFDPDYERFSISKNRKMRVFAMKLHTGLDFEPVKTAKTIVKSFSVYADGKLVYKTDDNFVSLVKIPLKLFAKQITIKFNETYGEESINLFSADFIGEDL